MPFPASRLADTTATGDEITGPGAPTIIIEGKPASCMGDAVAGSACTGTVTVGSPIVMFENKPATRVTSTVVGSNPETGAPVTTAVATGAETVLIP